MPLFAACLVIFAFSSLGLPGTNSFVGEFLVLVGAFRVEPAVAALAALGIILAAVYLLWMVQRVVWGKARPSVERLTDLSWQEAVILVPFVVAVFWIGLYPEPLLAVMHHSVEHVVTQVGRSLLPDETRQVAQWIAGRGTGP